MRRLLPFLALFVCQASGAFPDICTRCWYEVPNSKLSEVLQTPTPPGSGGPDGRMGWNGGAFDSRRSRLILAGAGGSGDYSGNEVYAFDLDSLKWLRIKDGASEYDERDEESPYYFNGGEDPDLQQPRPGYTYDQIEYDSTTDKIVIFGLPFTATNSTTWPTLLQLNLSTFTWDSPGDVTSPRDGVSARHPETGKLWFFGNAGAWLSEYDPGTETLTDHGDEWTSDGIDPDQTAAIMPSTNHMISIGTGHAYSWDLSEEGEIPNPELETTDCEALLGVDAPGFQWDPVLRKMVGWAGGTHVVTMDSTYTCHDIAPSDSNTVTPNAPQEMGTYGRWRYVPKYNVFVVVNSTDSSVFLYRPSDGTGSVPPSPPVVVITSPSEDTTVGSSSILVHYTVNSVPDSQSFVLEPGDNQVIVSSTDAGGTGRDTVHVYWDNVPPVVVITSPDADHLYNVSSISVAWTVGGVTQTAGTTEALAVDGAHYIIRSATDAVGNVGADTVRVYRDMTAPVVVITSPADGSYTQLNYSEVAWTVDGVPQTTETFANPLAFGANLIVRAASDAAGNSSSDTILVHVDYLPPVVTLDSPRQSMVIIDTSVDIHWSVDGVSQAPVHHHMDSSEANLIVLTAIDSALNTDSLKLEVYAGTLVPNLIGKSFLEADSILKTKALGKDSSWIDNDTVPTGVVFAQSPSAGDSLPFHFRVRYKISRGPDSKDLTPVSLTTKDMTVNPISLQSGGFVRLVVTNQGRSAVADSFQIVIFEDKNKDQRYAHDTDLYLGGTSVEIPLAAGDTLALNIAVSGGLTFNGNRISAAVDQANLISETDESNNGIHSMAQCKKIPLTVDYKPKLKWGWRDTAGTGFSSVQNTPVVGHFTDDNGDGKYDQSDVPEVFVILHSISGSAGKVMLLDGRDGHELWKKDLYVEWPSTPAIGDVDGDGVPDIAVIEGQFFSSNRRVTILDKFGNKKDSSNWQPNAATFTFTEKLSISDMDGDGKPEIIWGHNVFNHHCRQVFPDHFSANFLQGFPVDLDGDGFKEIVAQSDLMPTDADLGLTVFGYKEKAVLHRFEQGATTYPIVARTDTGSLPKILESRFGWSGDSIGSVQIYGTLAEPERIIPATVVSPPPGFLSALEYSDADDIFYGTGSRRIKYRIGSVLATFVSDPSHAASLPYFASTNLEDGSVTYRVFPSGNWGRGTVFDFADDSVPEILLQTHDSLYILDAAGNTLGKINSSNSSTSIIVADVDNDSHADIVVGGADPDSTNSLIVRAYSNPTWVGARTQFNQKDNTIVNINEDGSIPRFEPEYWNAKNTVNVQCTEGHYACVDMTASLPQFVRDTSGHDTLMVRVGNGGALALPAGIPVTVYAGHSGAQSKLTTFKSPSRLEAGEYFILRYPVADSLKGAFTFRIAADDSGHGNGGLDEIDEINNSVVLSVMVNNHAPVAENPGHRYAEPATAFLDTLHATDPDGDAVTFRLSRAPLGMAIDPETGILSWTPPEGLPRCTVTVAVSDPHQATTMASLLIYIGNASNHPPEIVSVPDASVPINTVGIPISHVFRYTILADDSDGEVLEYQADCLNCEGHSGAKPELNGNKLTWIPFQPAWAAGDSLLMRVVVTDARGGVDSQSFTLHVEDPEEEGNHRPGFVTTPPTTAVAGADYVYASKAVDADGDSPSYFLTTNPTGMSVSGGFVLWHTPATPGAVADVGLTAADGHGGSAHQSWQITLLPDDIPPGVNVSFSQNPIQPGHPVTVTVHARDNVGTASTALTLDGSPATLTGNQYTFTPTESGEYLFAATAEDTSGNLGHGTGILRVSASADNTPPTVSLSHSPANPDAGDIVTFTVDASDEMALDPMRLWVNVDGMNLPVQDGAAEYVAMRPGSFTAKVAAYDVSGNSALATDAFAVAPLGGDATAPTAMLASPVEDSTVYSRVKVIGTATDAHLAYYTLSYREVSTGTWVEFLRSDSPVDNKELGEIDATTLVNGDYQIRLDVYDRSGNANSASTQVHVTGEKKIGNFTLAFQDLTLPMAGLDLNVSRTYDSRIKTQGDFGIGWKMGLRSVTLSENRNQGSEWSIDIVSGFIPHYEINPQKPHTVTVTLPGGRKQEFTAEPRFFSPFVPAFGTMIYAAKPGSYGTLEALDAGEFMVVGGELFDINGTFEETYNPQVYKLTLFDGSYFIIDQGKGGVIESGDASGNKVEWDSSFVKHGTGSEIDFARDGQGRITGISDGAGRSVHYLYDVLGNLSRVVDPNGNTTLFRYGPDSYLNEIVDARGVLANRTEYDDDGRILRQINAAGDTLRMNHDIDHNLEEVMDFEGHVTSYGYDLHGNVTRKMDDAGNEWFYSYDSTDNLLSTLSPDGTLKSSTYDENGNEVSSTDESGHTTIRTYNSQGKPLTVTDPLGRTTEYDYDGVGNLIQETGPDGTVQAKRTYDSKGDLLAETDALGHATTHTYNASGWLLSTTDPLGHILRFGHDAAGNLLYQVDAKGDTTRFGYDNNGNRVAEVNSLGDTVKTQYNAINKIVKRIDALGRSTLSAYNNLGDKIADTAADSTVTSRTYDGQGNVATLTDAVGRTTTMQYDFANRLVKTIFPDLSYATTEYDALGRRIRNVDARGNATEYAYDEAGRNLSVRDALGNITQYEYDAAGRKTALIDALNHRTEYTYDDYDRLILTTYPNATSRGIDYDAAGRKISETDPMGFITHFHYDAAGNLAAVKDAEGDSTSYTYDANNNRLTQKDANGHTTSMAYDALNRMVSRTYPNGDPERWTYTPNGAMLSHVKGTDSTAFEYDAMDREVYRKHFNSGHEVTTTYTPDGKRETVTDYRGPSTFSYDNRGRLAGEGHPNGDSLENHYDAQGNRTSVITPFGTTSYTYDVLNRMATVVSPQSKTTTYHYDAVGNRDGVTFPNSTSTEYKYDNLNRLIRVRSYGSGNSILAHYAYTLNAAGIRTQVTEKDSSKVFYGYDSLYRLKSERRTGSHTDTMTYTYDPVGNRLTKGHRGVTTTYAYNNRDQLLSEWDGTDSTRYGYDPAGRILTNHYSWVDEDRLDSLHTPSASVKYAYDADGRRVKENTGGTVRQYLIDPLLPYGQVIAQTDGSNGLVVEHVYGLERVSQRRNGTSKYFLADGQGSVRMLADSIGAITDSMYYTSFGENLFSSGSTVNDFRYVGEQLDGNSGFYYNRARWMDPGTGRFVGVDPYGGDPQAPVSLHRYLYANANPVNFSDPSGRISIGELVVAINVRMTLSIQAVGAGFAISKSVGGAALRNLGLAVEQEAAAILQEFVGVGGISRNYRLIGEEGRRFIDFFIKSGENLALIEVKYKLPSKAGEALTRAASQIRLAASSEEAIQEGAQVILFTFKAPTASELTLLTQELGPGAGVYQHIHGFTGLLEWVRLFVLSGAASK